MGDWITGEALTSSQLARLHRYWLQQTRHGALPQRRDIDPADIPDLLPTLLLMDVDSTHQRFRFRLVGTRMAEVFGQDPTGKRLEHDGSNRDTPTLLPPLHRVVATAQPVACIGRLAWDNGAAVDSEWLFLPLGSGDPEVTMILAGADFFSATLQYPQGEPQIDLRPALVTPLPPLAAEVLTRRPDLRLRGSQPRSTARSPSRGTPG
jgi:hypothetical protein